jgi:recombinational DNA repair protein (RecF pathway)
MKKHEHIAGPQIECEKCGGETEIINTVYPKGYECICKKCDHKFIWASAEESY